MCYITLTEELNVRCGEGGPLWTCFPNDMQSGSGPIIITDTAACIIITHILRSALLKLSFVLHGRPHSCSCSCVLLVMEESPMFKFLSQPLLLKDISR